MRTAGRAIAGAVLVVVGGTLLLAQDYVTFKDQVAQDVFIASRAAVARGEGSVKNLRALLLKGHARVVQDNGDAVDSTVVIKILMPDAYLRVDTSGSTVRTTGFEGDHLLTSIREGGETSVPPPSLTATLLRAERARVTRLLMGSMAALTPTLRLIGRTAPGLGSMERPGEGAPTAATYDSAQEMRLIEFSGLDGFYMRYVVDAAKLPLRLEYRATKEEILDDHLQRPARGGRAAPSVPHRDHRAGRDPRGPEARRDPGEPGNRPRRFQAVARRYTRQPSWVSRGAPCCTHRDSASSRSSACTRASNAAWSVKRSVVSLAARVTCSTYPCDSLSNRVSIRVTSLSLWKSQTITAEYMVLGYRRASVER